MAFSGFNRNGAMVGYSGYWVVVGELLGFYFLAIYG
jgi:hypothetical protein